MMKTVPCPWCGKHLGVWFFFKALDTSNLVCPSCRNRFRGEFPGFGFVSGAAFAAVSSLIYLLWSGLGSISFLFGVVLTILAIGFFLAGELAFSLAFMNQGVFERCTPGGEKITDRETPGHGTNRSWDARPKGFVLSMFLWVYLGSALAWFALLGFASFLERFEIYEFAHRICLKNETAAPVEVFEFEGAANNAWILLTEFSALSPYRVVPPKSSLSWVREGKPQANSGFVGVVREAPDMGASPSAEQSAPRPNMVFKQGRAASGTIEILFSPKDFSGNTLPTGVEFRARPWLLLFAGAIFSLLGGLFIWFEMVSSEFQVWFGVVFSLSLFSIGLDLQFLMRFMARFGFSSPF